jgi:uncharacterized protein (DUF58 family)
MAERRRYLSPAAISRLGNLQLVARLVVEGATSGQHKSPYYGFNVEFSEHRRYNPGDELRHVDWKLYAKTDRYFVKLYEENTALRCWILLDASKSMCFGEGSLNKLEYGKVVAASLAYLLLHQKDAVGLATFGEGLRSVLPPSTKASHLHRIVETLEGTEGDGVTDTFAVLRGLVDHAPRRSLVVIVSDFLDDPDRILTAVRLLRYLKHEVVLLRVLAPEEVDFPYEDFSRFVDLEDGGSLLVDPRLLAGEYRSRMAEHLRSFRQRLHHERVDTELFRTDRPVEEVLAWFLTRRGRRRTA